MAEMIVFKNHRDDDSTCMRQARPVRNLVDATVLFADLITQLFDTGTCVYLMADWLDQSNDTAFSLVYNWDAEHTLTFAYVA